MAPLVALHPTAQLLDVGPSYLTELVAGTFGSIQIDTLGFAGAVVPDTVVHHHFEIDLNYLGPNQLLPQNQYHIILFCEVLEHLYTDPVWVLKQLQQLLTPGGYIILQTPNAVALGKRIQMVMGRNPFQQIASHRQNHFREYTGPELLTICQQAGLEPRSVGYHNYFDPAYTVWHRLYRHLGILVPRSWRDGITIVCERVDGGTVSLADPVFQFQ